MSRSCEQCAVGQALERRCIDIGRRDPEFRVLAAGADELVGVRFDPGVDPDHHVERRCGPRNRCQALELFVTVDDIERDAPFGNRLELRVGLRCTVKVDAATREAAAFGGEQLAERAHVDAQRCRSEMLGERGAPECFGGVPDDDPATGKRARETFDLEVELVEIDDEQRRTVRCGEFARGDPADRAIDRCRLDHR